MVGHEMNKVTIKDIAELSGFSKATVSRALNDSPRISEKTKKTINDFAKMLNYQPNPMARALVHQKTQLIGYVMRNFKDAFHPVTNTLLQGITEEISKYNYNLVLLTPDYGEVDYDFDKVSQGFVDGLIVSPQETKPKDIIKLSEKNLPFVLINNYIPGISNPCVRVDYNDICFRIIRHFYTLGHRRIALINGQPEFRISIDMLEGYKLALTASNLQFESELVVNGDYTEEESYKLMKILLDLSEPPTAVFGEDYMVMGAMRAIKEAGLSIPEDIAVIGFNDVPLATSVTPPLSSVQVHMDRVGKHAVDMIISQIEGGALSKQEVIIEGDLVIRASCGTTTNEMKSGVI